MRNQREEFEEEEEEEEEEDEGGLDGGIIKGRDSLKEAFLLTQLD